MLNSIRAALKSGKITNIKDDAKVVMWGYSGGSLASGWAAALQPSYAPELGGNCGCCFRWICYQYYSYRTSH